MQEDATVVDRLYKEATEVIKILQQTTELSLQITAGDHFRKSLLLAAASYFEHCLCTHVLDFVRERASGSTLIENFVKNKAIQRQYHTWFEWKANNANQFFQLFGSDFKEIMCTRIKEDKELKESMQAFLEIGNERNKLVHQNYAAFAMEKTLEEIYKLYQCAFKFVEHLSQALRECDRVS